MSCGVSVAFEVKGRLSRLRHQRRQGTSRASQQNTDTVPTLIEPERLDPVEIDNLQPSAFADYLTVHG